MNAPEGPDERIAFMLSSRTIRLGANPGTDSTCLLEVDVPASLLAACVLEDEGVHAVALLDGVGAVGVAGIDGGVDGVKSGRRREVVYRRVSLGSNPHLWHVGLHVPFLRDMAAGIVYES